MPCLTIFKASLLSKLYLTTIFCRDLHSALTKPITSFNISFESPELVVVGMQSDGKSTFIEGLLGFQFNIVDTSTRSSQSINNSFFYNGVFFLQTLVHAAR